MIVYVSSSVDNPKFKAIDVPDVDMARSVVRGLLAARSAFVFRGCGWVCSRRFVGGRATWKLDADYHICPF